ncbi:MAG: hypothetical protein WC342_08070 [Methanoregula sp.]
MTKQFGSGDEPWTEGELLFNAMVWTTGTRMWGASKELTEVMRKPGTGVDNVTWDTVELLMPGTQITVWSREEGSPFLNLKGEPDPDDLCPESDVIKQFWHNLYAGIERWQRYSIY